MTSQPSIRPAQSIRSARSGQTLLEVMIALFVLTVGFLGILSLLSQSIFLSKTVSNQTVATYLAAEGIELSKNLVDHDIYQHLDGFGGWGPGGIDPTFRSVGTYQFDYTWCDDIQQGNSCPQTPIYTGEALGFDPATNLYSYNGPVASPFTREIRITKSTTQEVDIESIVSWDTGPFSSQSVEVDDVFYNWHP